MAGGRSPGPQEQGSRLVCLPSPLRHHSPGPGATFPCWQHLPRPHLCRLGSWLRDFGVGGDPPTCLEQQFPVAGERK